MNVFKQKKYLILFCYYHQKTKKQNKNNDV